ncbi:hypothetical protein AAG906_019465 [Vitis piasezkii]
MKPRRRVGLQSPSRRRIQSLDIMTSCSNIVQHGPPPFWTKDLFSGPLFVMLFILHSKWKICVKSYPHFAVEEADVCLHGRSNTTYRPKEECIYLLDWVISTTFFLHDLLFVSGSIVKDEWLSKPQAVKPVGNLEYTSRGREFDGSSRPQFGLRLQQGRDHLIVMINIALLCTNSLSNIHASYVISCEHA